MLVGLIQPEPVTAHGNRLAYGSGTRPPETGLAVLAAWVKAYALVRPEVVIFDPWTKYEDLVVSLAKCDLVGLSDWCTNHEICMRMAMAMKASNNRVKVIVGGANAAALGRLILMNHPEVDYVAGSHQTFDGEEALTGLADGRENHIIPNLWYRDEGKICFSYAKSTDLNMMPLWDFSAVQNLGARMSEYLADQEVDPWLVSPVTIFGCRGCIKAAREGRCSYCTSSVCSLSMLSPAQFWAQVGHLVDLYGARTFYISDDVFTLSKARLDELALYKPVGLDVRLRAYSYLPDLAKLNSDDLVRVGQSLGKIGVFNLFFGSESFNRDVMAGAGKEGVNALEAIRIMKTLYQVGRVKTTLAVLVGLPGESEESLSDDLEAIRRVSREARQAFERLYISYAMPLRGTELFRRLVLDPVVCGKYERITDKRLENDDSPEYRLLIRLGIEKYCSVGVSKIESAVQRMMEVARECMPQHRIGGFLPLMEE